MANAVKWEAGFLSRGTVLTTELDALANTSRTNVGTEINNSTNLDQFGIFELSVDFVSAPTAGAYVQIHAVLALDGTNYADGSSTVDPGDHTVVATIPIRASTAAQKYPSQLFHLLPAKTKYILLNETGQAFPASGSTLTLYTTNDEVQ